MTITLELPKHVTSLATAGVLVNVKVTVWTGTKADSAIASDVSAKAGARGKVGRWSHELLAGDPDLRAVLNHRQTVYNAVTRETYDWMGDWRYLPSCNVQRWRETYQTLLTQWNTLLDKLFTAYPDKVAAQAFVRGELFRASDYPTVEQLRDQFAMGMSWAEVPVGDFRVQVATDLANDMRTSLQLQMQDKLAAIHARQVQQLQHVMQSLSHCCDVEQIVADDGSVTVRRRKIYDSTVQRAIELCDTFEQFNPQEDATLAQIRDSLRQALGAADATALRASDSLRAKVKSDVDSIISKFQF